MTAADPERDAPARPAAGPWVDPRTRMLLEASIPGTLLRLATPNVLVMVVQAAVGLMEIYFIGKLGTEALAGVTLVFPALMLMQMMSGDARPSPAMAPARASNICWSRSSSG